MRFTKNILPITITLLKKNLDILIFLALIEIKLLCYGKQISPDFFDYKLILYPVLFSILPLVSICFIFKSTKRTTLLYILDFVISIILIADIVYYRYFKDVITVAALRNGVMLGGMGSSIKSLLNPMDLMYLLDILVLLPIIRFYKKRNINSYSLMLRIPIFLIVFIVSIAMDGTYVYKLSKDQPMLISTMSNKIYLTKVLGNVNFHVLDTYNFLTNNIYTSKKLSTEKVKEIQTSLGSNSSNISVNLNGAGQGKNLIVIQVEALQQFAINAKINGQEITPNLNKWINKSLYFDNYFYQVAAGNTSDAEFMSNNSLYPAASGAAYYLYAGNTYSSLPKELGDKGYYTAALHGYQEGFWNRNVMYKAQNFNDFYGEHSYVQDETVGLGLSDKSFLNQSLDKLKTFKEPYYSFLITLSSHYPYNDVKGYGTFDTGEYENTFMGNYLKGIHYTDEQLGTFLNKLDEEGITKNSIIVLYGDHSAIPKEHIEELYKFENLNNPSDLQWFNLQKVPMFIHFPSDEHEGINHTYSGQMDLYPTLSNLFNLPKKYMLGKDILNTSDNTVTFRNGSFADGKNFYISWTDTYYDILSGNKIPENSDLKTKKQNTLETLRLSDDILNHNLLKEFEAEK